MSFDIVVPVDGPTILILMTQLVLTLYGAGLRRPFGSLQTVQFLPRWLRRSHALVLVADILFVAFMIAMCTVVFAFANRWWAIGMGLRCTTSAISSRTESISFCLFSSPCC
jgi:hypothetical protein